MSNSLFYNHIEKSDINLNIIEEIEKYIQLNPKEQLYLITAPLGENKYDYEYSPNVVVVLSPKHKIIFIDLSNDEDSFDDYYEDFMEDVNSISDKYKYQKHIGRVRKWRKEFTTTIKYNSKLSFSEILNSNKLDETDYRKCELIISLLTGSINNIEKVGVETPTTLLEKVKHNIILFDGEQTRFIYKQLPNKRISIQGLSGTGKTELLMHKLKEIYSSEEDIKIYFTCHNIALANTLKERIPTFFDFMKVEKQIKWNQNLWVDRAWGSKQDPNSGLYSYICDFYNIPFYRWNHNTTYNDIFSRALDQINKIENLEYAFDYILIDEKQDFPEVFFELCEKIARHKVYVAGDIFQDIFENNIKNEVENVDYVLNKCYRTAPRILMFAHAIGMGLFEKNKLNWLEDSEWESSGYYINRDDNYVLLNRDSIRRFEDLEETEISNMNILQHTGSDQVIDIIKQIKIDNPTVEPDDIAVIMLDKDNYIYDYIDHLEFKIRSEFKWNVNKAVVSKQKIPNQLFISNVNNVKGLEFPFVICVTNEIKDTYGYRNSLYTMLTRSFLQSFLLVEQYDAVRCQIEGLQYIRDNDAIRTKEPTSAEKVNIQKRIVKVKSKSNISFYDFINGIFKEQGIDKKYWKKFIQALPESYKDDFDEDGIIQFINDNKKYYCQ
ncbi:DNA helicase [Vibrio jasicida]|uniref:DEAD/DEAH box helicase n=1 Tax=Vibrio jasicida TaxID=766224 RepID=UPI002894F719|nr:DNA helicase [Vibrio jasicida]